MATGAAFVRVLVLADVATNTIAAMLADTSASRMRSRWKAKWPAPGTVVELDDEEENFGTEDSAVETQAGQAGPGADEVKDEDEEHQEAPCAEDIADYFGGSLVPLPLENPKEPKKPRYDYADGDSEQAPSSASMALGPTVRIPAEVISATIKNTECKQFKYPWEKGRLGRFFDNKSPLSKIGPKLQPSAQNFVRLNLNVKEGLSVDATWSVQIPTAETAIYGKVVKRMMGGSYIDERAARKASAIQQWWDLLQHNLEASDPGRFAILESH